MDAECSRCLREFEIEPGTVIGAGYVLCPACGRKKYRRGLLPSLWRLFKATGRYWWARLLEPGRR
jgi:hypothetical protein